MWLYRFWLKLQGLFRRNRSSQRLNDEIQFHLDQQIAENLAAGMSAKEARYAAMRAFGNSTLLKEESRDTWGWTWLEQLTQDVRYAARTLRKSPGFTTVAVLTLALGIGANAAIFSVVDAAMLRPLPVNDPQRLALFTWTAHVRPKFNGHSDYGDCEYKQSERDCSFSVPLFKTMSAQASNFSSVTAFAGPLGMDFSGNGSATIADGEFVSGDFFPTLDVKTILGRPLAPSDDSPSASPAIVLNYRYWQRAFGGNPGAVGRTVRLNNVPFLIVGVADSHFPDLTPGKTTDFFLPLSFAGTVKGEWWGNDDRIANASTWWVVMVGRLKPGVSNSQAQAEATTIFRNEMIHGAKPFSKETDDPAILLMPAQEGLNGERAEVAPMFYLMMIAVGLVLLIACANVAGLMLARSATRQREMAVRLALGAGRARLVRQVLTESLMLSAAGGALGVIVAIWGVDAISTLMSSGYGPFPFVVAPDWRVIAFTLGVTLATGILFGLAPALRGARVDLTPALKDGASVLPGRGSRTGRRRLGDALVVTQVALSIVVLVGAGLLVRTLHNLHQLNPGFDTRNILLFGINPTIAGYKDAQTAQLYGDLQQRLAALPGVLSVSYSEDPLLSGRWSADDVHLDGAPPNSNVNTATLTVGLEFFSTMRLPLLAGRTFKSGDFVAAATTIAAQKAAAEAAIEARISGTVRSVATPAAIAAPPVPVNINQMFARKFFPGENALGKHMGDPEGDEAPPGPHPGYTIIGIVADAKYNQLRREIGPTMYLPLVGNSAHFELRTASNPTALVKSVREVVSHADSNLPLFEVRTQTEQIEQTLFQERLMSRLSSFFAALALVLACIGLYGLLAYEVARRIREIGIRLALGAQQRDVARLVVQDGIILVLFGAAIGIGAALGVTRYMASMLFGVTAKDPMTITYVAILLMLVALAACLIPARRATRVDPIVALRYE